jgi:hypothetical protein
MTWQEAVAIAYRLQAKWVGKVEPPDVGYNLDRIHASMLQEARWHRTGKSSASAALISETKGDLILLGKVRKALAK